MTLRHVLVPVLACLGLAGCVAYPAGPPPGPVYAPAPPPAFVGPPPAVYIAPVPRRRVWVPGGCDRYGRCHRGRWVWR